MTKERSDLLQGTLDRLVLKVGLAIIAALATYVPARRATPVDPVLTLRGE